MSITINGATNTLTAASGLAIAGDTAVTGTLSATGASTFTGDASATNPLTVKDTAVTYATNDNYIRFLNSSNSFVGSISHPAETTLGVFGTNGVDVIVGAGLGTTRGSFTSTGLSVTGTLSASGVTSVTDTTDATSTTSASLKTAGGLGVAKKGYFGDNIVMASGKGIDFSATSNGSGTTTSEVLSDYEEGTWTPTIAFGGASVGVTYGITEGTYTKIGRLVTLQGQIVTTAKGSSTGSVTIGGLPFTVSNSTSLGSLVIEVASGLVVTGHPIGRTTANNTTVDLYQLTAGTFAALTDANVSAATQLNFTVTYFV